MFGLLLLVPVVVLSEETISPLCNFAADSVHSYPIGVCVTEKVVDEDDPDVTTYSAFRYICEGEEVVRYNFDTSEYCDGQYTDTEVVTSDLEGFQCDLGFCEYSYGCSYTGCAVNDTCTECEDNKADYSRNCLPYILNQCHGSAGSYREDLCMDGVLWKNFYKDSECSDGSLEFGEEMGGEDTDCLDDSYYEIECYDSLLPSCDYAATDTHYYPIGACEKDKTIDEEDNTISYFAFNYVCISGDVYRNEFDGSDYCDGPAVTTERVNYLLQHYACDLGACNWADGCQYELNEGCDDDTDECEYNVMCRPTITDQCWGFKGELLQYHTCEERNVSVQTDLFYFGDECATSTFAFQEELDSGECSDGEEFYRGIQCVASNAYDEVENPEICRNGELITSTSTSTSTSTTSSSPDKSTIPSQNMSRSESDDSDDSVDNSGAEGRLKKKFNAVMLMCIGLGVMMCVGGGF